MLSTSLPHPQGIATGKYHAAVLTNSAEWEAACVKAGRQCGDLVHPLVYCPELHFSEFTSAVADMKNSVAVGVEQGGPRSPCEAPDLGSEQGRGWPSHWSPCSISIQQALGHPPHSEVPHQVYDWLPVCPQGESRPLSPAARPSGTLSAVLHAGPSTPGPFLQTPGEVVTEDGGQEGAGCPLWPPPPWLGWKLMTAF